MRYLGLDLGTKTLGIAISDKSAILASFYKVLRHNENYSLLINELRKIIKEEKIEKIVLGMPKNMNNTLGPKAELSIKFKKDIEEKLGLEVILEDERMTTVSAEKILLEGNKSRAKRKEIIDGVAAQIILQSYLDRKGVENGK